MKIERYLSKQVVRFFHLRSLLTEFGQMLNSGIVPHRIVGTVDHLTPRSRLNFITGVEFCYYGHTDF